jgi:peptide deformylase
MSEIKLLKNDHPSLTTKLEGCSDDLDRQQIVDDLSSAMEHHQGIGLSANQIGISERVFVMYSDIKTRDIMACFNPKIITESQETVVMKEGCLTYPGLWLEITRPEGIEVEFEDVNGDTQQKALFGLECRVFQHEMDHMEGTSFTNIVSRMKLDRAIKRQQKVLKKSKIVMSRL